MNTDAPLESHPWAPFVPSHSRALIMGTFPPGPHRWAMDFYYPNPGNDFWKIMGMIACGSASAFYDSSTRKYRLDDIRLMLERCGIALSDTGRKVRRLKGNASDKHLLIVEPVDLSGLLERMPECVAIATTGEKAASVVAGLTDTVVPRMGEHVLWNRHNATPIAIWRLPSTSRAYPLAVAAKADHYRRFLVAAGCIAPAGIEDCGGNG